MLLLIKFTFLYSVVLMLVALGGMFSERSGIINIALEGIMVIGGLAGVLAAKFLAFSPAVNIILSILIAGGAGLIYALLLGFASINLKADQTIGGTALNILATAIAMVIAKRVAGGNSAQLDFSNLPYLFSIGGLELSVFLPVGIILLLAAYFILYKTRLGLRLRSCGEHPQAADSVGINVYRMRYTGVMFSGFLGGIGGMAYIVPAISKGRDDLRPVEAVPYRPGCSVLLPVPCHGKHRGQLPAAAGPALAEGNLQHDALHCLHGSPGADQQEEPGAQGGRHSLRQGHALTHSRGSQKSSRIFPGGFPYMLLAGYGR